MSSGTDLLPLDEYSLNCNDTCAESCVNIYNCNIENCPCTLIAKDAGGPWGDVMDVIFALLPILFLIIVTVKPHPWPTTISLPVSAVLLAWLRLAYFQSDPLLVMGSIVLGIHEAFTPLSIMAGAIILFDSMEATLCLPFMMREMKALTQGHPMAELLLLFAFCYCVEGASGFGTPVALAAPMLVSTGHPAKESVIVLLLFNTFATVWGAVGTPIWFGLNASDTLTDDQLLEISQKAALALAASGYILMPWICMILIPRKIVLANWIFLYASLTVTVGPAVALAFFNYEFPSLLGGLVGMGLTSLLISKKVGLRPYMQDDEEEEEAAPATISEVNLRRRNDSNISEMTNPVEVPAAFVEARSIMTGGETLNPVPEANNSNSKDDNLFKPEETVTIVTEEAKTPETGDDDDEEQQLDIPATNATADTTNINTTEHSIFSFLAAVSHHDSTAQIKNSTHHPDKATELLGPRKSLNEGYLQELVLRTFPIWGVVLVLILTRIEQIGIKPYLTKQTPNFSIYFGTWGTFRLSASAVFQLRDILTYPNLNWSYALFYVPFLIPFVLVSALSMILFRKDLQTSPIQILKTVAKRLKNPMIALMGALALVQLMIRTGSAAPAYILGTVLADWFQEGFVVICPLLGALGSFFSGSTTVSNLTFGSIQRIAAESIGTSMTTMLALQAVGGSAGNGICLNNIIAACAVVGLNIGEGQILMQTYKYVFMSTTIATVVMLAFFFRFD